MQSSPDGKLVGEKLRNAREAKGLQLEDVSRVIRIGKQFLAAMEHDNWEALPNPAYVKGFLRSYASFLGLSADELILMYEDSRKISVPSQPEHKAEISKAVPKILSIGMKRKWFLPVILLLIAGFTAYMLGNTDRKSKEENAPIAVQETKAPSPPVVQQPASSARSSLPAKQETPQSNITPPLAVAPHTGIFLRLTVTSDTWLNIIIDGNLSKRYELKAGDVIEWKGENSFTLDLGNAGGVTAEFNGKRLKPFGSPGATAHVVLTPESR